ncbi:energy-coupled thiamine transporter ThiT [Eubacterium multiforme]|uniref:Thiamine transporter n=1 Tax=Eubacterium multiforme TaxID=83339 RepID=A0ABT9UUC5_9FIRM|nr:energy-coupled thiamine transporter ThiT [Eubacterium multiforme]MDQ0149928.1 thiamine transporter [Eubacterium multiforme]
MEFFTDWGARFSKLYTNLPKKFETIIKDPMTILTIIACLVIFIALFKIKKIKLNARIITHIGIALALATILNVFRLYRFPQGGSITLGCMVPILIIAFAYGKEIGFLTGFLYGLINLLTDPFIIHPLQMLFDYPLPSLAMGLAGFKFFKNRRMLGVFVAFFAKFLCHFISGVVFFGSYAPAGMGVVLYSLSVNLPLIGAEMVICMVILKLIPTERIIRMVNPDYVSFKPVSA